MRILLIATLTLLAPAALTTAQSSPHAPAPTIQSAAETLDPEMFWSLVEGSRAGHDDCDSQADALGERLRQLTTEQIVGFDRQLKARLAESYRWDLWGVAYLVNGGASDDAFEYFRGWLVAQGREYFESALRDPQRAAERAEPGEAECEAIRYAAAEAYAAKTGEELPPSDVLHPAEPTGQPWSEEELDDLFPAVARRFG